MSGVRISFVVASFNGAPYIREQICSILNAIGDNDEIVISDDGSTDGTLAEIDSIADSRIRVLVRGERLGYQGNFERAVRFARGQFIFFSDQDDVCLPARVPRSLEALSEAECVCGDAVVVDETLTILNGSYFASRGAKFGATRLLIKPAVIGATLACRRGFVMDNLPFPKAVPHDMWLSIRASWQHQLIVIKEPFILYRRHKAALSATGTGSRRQFKTRIAERLRLVRAIFESRRRAGRIYDR